jgi:hypothetical protein
MIVVTRFASKTKVARVAVQLHVVRSNYAWQWGAELTGGGRPYSSGGSFALGLNKSASADPFSSD